MHDRIYQKTLLSTMMGVIHLFFIVGRTKISHQRQLIFLLALSLKQSAVAGTSAFISVDAVTVFGNLGVTQNVQLMNTLGNTYEASHPWHTRETGLFGLGIRSYQKHDLEMNTSLRFLPVIRMPTQGEVLQLYSPQFRNLAYSYNVSSNFLFIDHSLTWAKYRIKPGLLVGLGGVSNTASAYAETPLNKYAAPSIDHFTTESQIQFTYELGAVLEYTYNALLTIECAYRYLNAGHGQLGRSPLQNTSDHLSTGLIYYQTINVGVRLYHDL